MSSPSERTSVSRMLMQRSPYKNRDSTRPRSGGGVALIRPSRTASSHRAEVTPAHHRHHDEHDRERDRQRPIDVAHGYSPTERPIEATLSYGSGPEYGLARRKNPTRPPTPRRNIRCASAPRYVVSGAAFHGFVPVRMVAMRTSKPWPNRIMRK